MDDERIAQLQKWMDADPMVRRVVIACIGEHNCPDTKRLLERHPMSFDDLYEAVEMLNEDLPSPNDPPGYGR